MTKLNQIIAIEKGVKARAYGEITEVNKLVQKPDLFNGMVRTYKRKDEDSEDLPAEKKRVQLTAGDAIRAFARSATELMGVTARKDWTNCIAKAAVSVDGKVIVADAPVSYLLFLEKTLTDFRTFVGNMPVLDEAESWTKDESSGLYKSEPTPTHRTKKTQKPVVMLQPTPEHPGQAVMVVEDIIVGFWDLVKHSGAMPKPEKIALLERIETLLKAIKEAREEANGQEAVATANVGEAIFEHLIGG